MLNKTTFLTNPKLLKCISNFSKRTILKYVSRNQNRSIGQFKYLYMYVYVYCIQVLQNAKCKYIPFTTTDLSTYVKIIVI